MNAEELRAALAKYARPGESTIPQKQGTFDVDVLLGKPQLTLEEKEFLRASVVSALRAGIGF